MRKVSDNDSYMCIFDVAILAFDLQFVYVKYVTNKCTEFKELPGYKFTIDFESSPYPYDICVLNRNVGPDQVTLGIYVDDIIS
jgi:hypothetical protein